MGNLVRSMNCYYSNLIEGHDTHPRDIDRALVNDFSAEPNPADAMPGVPSLRLCNDCVAIRRGFGEHLETLD